MITPTAAQGQLDNIILRKDWQWRVQHIYVRNPIQMEYLTRNEQGGVSSKGSQPIDNARTGIQRRTLLLRDVSYVIQCYLESTNPMCPSGDVQKMCEMARRHLKQGKCRRSPYMGMSDFPAAFRLLDEGTPITTIAESRDLGWMPHTVYWANGKRERIGMFRAVMVDGHIRVPTEPECIHDYERAE